MKKQVSTVIVGDEELKILNADIFTNIVSIVRFFFQHFNVIDLDEAEANYNRQMSPYFTEKQTYAKCVSLLTGSARIWHNAEVLAALTIGKFVDDPSKVRINLHLVEDE